MTMNLTEKCRGWFLWQTSEFGKSIVLWHVLQTKILKAEVGRRKKKESAKDSSTWKYQRKRWKWIALYWSFTYLHECVQAVFLMSLSNEGFALCRTFSRDVMAANDTGVPKHWNDVHPTDVVVRNKPGKDFFFVPINLHRCWSREWKCSIYRS